MFILFILYIDDLSPSICVYASMGLSVSIRIVLHNRESQLHGHSIITFYRLEVGLQKYRLALEITAFERGVVVLHSTDCRVQTADSTEPEHSCCSDTGIQQIARGCQRFVIILN